MKTYDCFTFFNELDLLDIRLNTLNDVVDYFVLVESKKTHTYKDKPLYFLDNIKRFDKFKDKIIHIILNDLPSETNAWANENHQRNAISKGLTDCEDSDIIIVSDLDEIPNPEEIELIKTYIDDTMVFDFSQKLYYYYLNMLVIDNWTGSKLCTYSKFKSFSPQTLRMNNLGNTLIENGGWHFSYMGNEESIIYKLESFAETQLNTEEIKNNIQARLNQGLSIFDENKQFRCVDFDLTYPKYILNNLEKFNHLIKK
jgi:beta-1,4-mannosyl-glycoprotein beta-1,4-N-acetylglucosaminyltransferase